MVYTVLVSSIAYELLTTLVMPSSFPTINCTEVYWYFGIYCIVYYILFTGIYIALCLEDSVSLTVCWLMAGYIFCIYFLIGKWYI